MMRTTFLCAYAVEMLRQNVSRVINSFIIAEFVYEI